MNRFELVPNYSYYNNSGSNSGFEKARMFFDVARKFDRNGTIFTVDKERTYKRKKKIIIIEQTISRSNEESRTSP